MKYLSKYNIFENVQQSKAFLQKKSIPETCSLLPLPTGFINKTGQSSDKSFINSFNSPTVNPLDTFSVK